MASRAVDNASKGCRNRVGVRVDIGHTSSAAVEVCVKPIEFSTENRQRSDGLSTDVKFARTRWFTVSNGDRRLVSDIPEGPHYDDD